MIRDFFLRAQKTDEKYIYKTEERQNKTQQDIVRVRVVQSWVKMRPSEQATSIESPEKVGWW